MKLFTYINRLNKSIKLAGVIAILTILGLFVVFPQIHMGWPKAPPALANADKAILMDIHKQTLYGYENGKLKFRFLIETGMAGHETPTGSFRVARKDAHYHSRTYDAPMPYSLFFVPERGIAMHTGLNILPHWVLKQIVGPIRKLGSHGCVHVGLAESVRLFYWAPVDTPVLVVDRVVK